MDPVSKILGNIGRIRPIVHKCKKLHQTEKSYFKCHSRYAFIMESMSLKLYGTLLLNTKILSVHDEHMVEYDQSSIRIQFWTEK